MVVRSRVVVAAMAALAVPLACGGSGDAGQADASCQPKTMVLQAAADGSVIPPTIPPGEAGLRAVIEGSFCTPTWNMTFPDGTRQTWSARPLLPQDEAACISDGLVDDVGEPRLRELMGVGPWGLLGFGLSNNQGDRQIQGPEAEAIVNVFQGCAKAWKLLLIWSVTEGTDKISDGSARCASDRLPDDVAHQMLVGEIDRAYDDPTQPGAQSFPDLIQPLIDVFEVCLTPEELDLLDWN